MILKFSHMLYLWGRRVQNTTSELAIIYFSTGEGSNFWKPIPVQDHQISLKFLENFLRNRKFSFFWLKILLACDAPDTELAGGRGGDTGVWLINRNTVGLWPLAYHYHALSVWDRKKSRYDADDRRSGHAAAVRLNSHNKILNKHKKALENLCSRSSGVELQEHQS